MNYLYPSPPAWHPQCLTKKLGSASQPWPAQYPPHLPGNARGIGIPRVLGVAG